MPSLRPRISPSFAVALLALVLASGGVGYAAGKVTSRQIKDGTIQSRDVRDGALAGRDVGNGSLDGRDIRDGSLGGADVGNGSIPRSKLDRRCAVGESSAFGGCVRRVASGRSSRQAAVDDCSRRGGRLPTTLEILWIASHDEYSWADGNPSQYEFTGDYTSASTFTPIAFDRAGNPIFNASGLLLWHHCVTY